MASCYGRWSVVGCITLALASIAVSVFLSGIQTVSKGDFQKIQLLMSKDDVVRILGEPTNRMHGTVTTLIGHVSVQPVGSKHGAIKVMLWENKANGNAIIIWMNDQEKVLEKEWRPLGNEYGREVLYIDESNRVYRCTYDANGECKEQREQMKANEKGSG